MADSIKVEIDGLKQLQAAFDKAPALAEKHMSAAAKEAGDMILDTEGLRKYPPGNQGRPQPPKTPKQRAYLMWAIRTGAIELPYKRGGLKSERYGTQFYVEGERYGAVIGNRASYARWLTDDAQQSQYMAALGWRKLFDVATEKIDDIKAVYEGWIERLADEIAKESAK